jgi:hypothetical protein
VVRLLFVISFFPFYQPFCLLLHLVPLVRASFWSYCRVLRLCGLVGLLAFVGADNGMSCFSGFTWLQVLIEPGSLASALGPQRYEASRRYEDHGPLLRHGTRG